MPTTTTPQQELTFLQTDFASTLISNTPTTVTNFTVSLKNFLNSKHSTLNLKQFGSNEEIVRGFNGACQKDVNTLLEDALYTPAISLLDKSSLFSDHLRLSGNEYYKQRRLYESMRCYTLAAAFAPKQSKSSALAFSNRSACFYEQSLYTESLHDITRFEQIYESTTDNIALKLRERKSKCIEKLEQIPPKRSNNLVFCEQYFQLKTRNATIPSAESCVGIKNDEIRGRHVVNSSDKVIPPGQLIILEQPFSHILLRTYSFEYKHCTTCLKDLNGGGIPCDSCVFAIYCSNACKLSSPHSPTECQISKYLHELKPDRTVHLSLSILLKLPPSHFLSPSPLSLLTPTSIQEEQQLSPYPPGFTPEGTYSSDSYTAIENLIYHREILTPTDLLKYATYSLIITTLLAQKTKYFPVPPSPVRERFQTNFLLHLCNLPCNAHSSYKLNAPKHPTQNQIKTSEYEEIGAGAFALLSMINHSCDPNVVRITLPNAITAVITIHSIKPQEEIRDNYGVHFATDKLQPRRDHLTSHYNFTCDCTPCNENWPTIEILLKSLESRSMRICPRCSCDYVKSCQKCKYDHNDEEYIKSHNSAETTLLHNNPTESFQLSCKSLSYFDSSFKKPHKLICISQEYMKQALFLVTRSMFR